MAELFLALCGEYTGMFMDRILRTEDGPNRAWQREMGFMESFL